MIQCTWCGASYAAFQSICGNCGGPLPPSPGDDPGAPPPPPPRKLPSAYVRRIRFSRNVLFILGMVFGPIGLLLFLGLGIGGVASGLTLLVLLGAIFGVVFGGIGAALGTIGYRKAAATLRALEHGRAAIGRITDVYLDTSVRINGRSPYAIRYSFKAGGVSVEGKAQTWDSLARDRRPGQQLHVLYVESDPTQNTIYPPVK